MNANEFKGLLRKFGACAEGVDWADGKSLAQVWDECERGDWMLWLAAHMIGSEGWPSRKEVVLAACACAETALQYILPGEDRPRNAIETARRWVRGEATMDEVRSAASDAYAAYAAASAASSSAFYAAASAYAVFSAAASAYAVFSAASDAYAAYAAAAYAYASDVWWQSRSKALNECAEIVRRMLKIPTTETLKATNG